MGEARLRIAGVLLGAFSVLASVLAAPVVLNVAVQPDSASTLPGGLLLVTVAHDGDPLAGRNVTATAADGSWTDHCTTDAAGRCFFDPLSGAKGTVAVADATRAFFLPEGQDAAWDLDVASEDDGTPLGLGPRDALPAALVLVASLFGLAAAIALYRRTALRLALSGVGMGLLAHLFVFQPVGLAVAGFAGYALVRDVRLFAAVPLDGADPGEEEE